MKSKNLFAATMLLGGAMFVNAQVSNTYTGLGNENGATAATSSAFVGYQAGKNITGTQNTIVGHQAGGNFVTSATGTGTGNSFIGYKTGFKNTTGSGNILIGKEAGTNNTTGSGNVFLGYESGVNNTSGSGNISLGHQAGANNSTATGNIFIGQGAGLATQSTSYNVYLGYLAGLNTSAGSGNVFLGAQSGSNATGKDNIFIGFYSGSNETGNNKLHIANTPNTSSTPSTIYGDLSTKKIAIGGMVPYATSDGFPTTAGSVNVSGYKLFVKGGILTEEVRVASSAGTGWADYVFAKDYKLPTLAEVENYIAKNGHLPNVPSAETVKNDGIGLGEMAKIQQEKIEELTLYAIAQDKKVEAQQKQLDQQQKEIDALKAAVKVLTEKK
nr:hypothetical protein [uncultured Flavobacterium sp.]